MTPRFRQVGRGEIYRLIPEFRYVTSEIAVGAAPLDSAGIAALKHRGFLQVLDIRTAGLAGSPAETGARGSAETGAGRKAVSATLVETQARASGLHYLRVGRDQVAHSLADSVLGAEQPDVVASPGSGQVGPQSRRTGGAGCVPNL